MKEAIRSAVRRAGGKLDDTWAVGDFFCCGGCKRGRPAADYAGALWVESDWLPGAYHVLLCRPCVLEAKRELLREVAMDDAKRCGTCRHWNTTNEVQGICKRIGEASGAVAELDIPAGEKAQVQSSYDVTNSFLATTHDFGCVLHESKGA